MSDIFEQYMPLVLPGSSNGKPRSARFGTCEYPGCTHARFHHGIKFCEECANDIDAKRKPNPFANGTRPKTNGAKPATEPATVRKMKLTKASDIPPRPVHWLWAGATAHEGRIPKGMLVLVAGREGTGKSSVLYTIAAQLTNGTLPGAHFGAPKSVIVAAYEDSWNHTIVPRLMAAGADLDRVLRVDVETVGDVHMSMTLPQDNRMLEDAIKENEVVMVILDPMMSALDARMKSKDYQSVYQSLLPIAGIADRTGCSFVGITHFNKTSGTDPMARIMGSAAFAGVVRGALIVHKVKPDERISILGQDPFEDTETPEQLYLLGHEKNNVGRMLPTLVYSVTGKFVAETDEGPVYAPVVTWHGETDETVAARMEAEEAPKTRETKTSTAQEWLRDFLSDGWHTKEDAMKEAESIGHKTRTIERASTALSNSNTLRRFQRVPGPVMWTTNRSAENPS